MRPGKRKALDLKQTQHQLLDEAEKIEASVRTEVEHPFRVIKQQFGYAKVRYRGLQKNTDRLMMLFALGNLWMARKRSVRRHQTRIRTRTARCLSSRCASLGSDTTLRAVFTTMFSVTTIPPVAAS